jgi:hypothetical protein
VVRNATRRLTDAVQATLAPEERLTNTGIGWAAPRRDNVPLLFQGRRQYWVALTDRRLLVFERRRRGPSVDDLVLGKRYDFFTLEAVKKLRPLLQVRIKGANGSRQVLEFRPGQRGLGGELARRLGSTPPPPRALNAAPTAAEEATAAFWGDS